MNDLSEKRTDSMYKVTLLFMDCWKAYGWYEEEACVLGDVNGNGQLPKFSRQAHR